MTFMKHFTLFIAGVLIAAGLQAQEISKDLKPFRKIVASPRINVILQKGDAESIRVVYDGVSKSKINVEVYRKTLSIYLDNARKVEKPSSRRDPYGTLNTPMYAGAAITAYVTYRELESLEIRGNQELTCHGPIESDEFRLRAYGENEIRLASLKTDFFKASLYGENELKIKTGSVLEQKYKLYGQNKIDTRDMESLYTTASIFGEGRVRINSSEEVRIDAFGEPSIYVDGGAFVNKRLVFGRTDVYRY